MPKLPGSKSKLIDPIWEQQPTEHKSFYMYFQLYCTLKPFERTYAKAWELLNSGTSREGKPVSTYFKRIGQMWSWVERAAAKDFHDAQTAQSRWMERDKERRETQYELGGKLVTQSKRILNKIEGLPDEQLKVSLSEAKDVALAGTQLQEAAIPSVQLAVDQMQWLITSLPEEKRILVLQKLREARDRPTGLLPMHSEIIDAEYSEISDDDDMDDLDAEQDETGTE